MRILSIAIAMLIAATGIHAQYNDSALLTQAPMQLRPGTRLFWRQGQLSRSTITADMNFLWRAGYGRVTIVPDNDVIGMDREQWESLLGHAVSEASRYGLQLELSRLPLLERNYDSWMDPSMKSRRLVWEFVRKSNTSSITDDPDYQEICLLAFVARAGSNIQKTNAEEVDRDEIQILDSEEQVSRLPRLKQGLGWVIVRFGSTIMSESPDLLSRTTAQEYWQNILDPLLQKVRQHTGTTLMGFHPVSWERHRMMWTPDMLQLFQRKRGYDLTPWLLTFAGIKVISPEGITAQRLTADYNRTLQEIFQSEFQKTLAMNMIPYSTGWTDFAASDTTQLGPKPFGDNPDRNTICPDGEWGEKARALRAYNDNITLKRWKPETQKGEKVKKVERVKKVEKVEKVKKVEAKTVPVVKTEEKVPEEKKDSLIHPITTPAQTTTEKQKSAKNWTIKPPKYDMLTVAEQDNDSITYLRYVIVEKGQMNVKHIWMDLGKIHGDIQVTFTNNGKSILMGKKPYVADVRQYLHEGVNELKIRMGRH